MAGSTQEGASYAHDPRFLPLRRDRLAARRRAGAHQPLPRLDLPPLHRLRLRRLRARAQPRLRLYPGRSRHHPLHLLTRQRGIRPSVHIFVTQGAAGDALQDLGHHAVVDRGRLIGLWLYDPDAADIVYTTFGPPEDAVRAEVARTAAFIRDDLGDARIFSLDSPACEDRRAAGPLTRTRWPAPRRAAHRTIRTPRCPKPTGRSAGSRRRWAARSASRG